MRSNFISLRWLAKCNTHLEEWNKLAPVLLRIITGPRLLIVSDYFGSFFAMMRVPNWNFEQVHESKGPLIHFEVTTSYMYFVTYFIGNK